MQIQIIYPFQFPAKMDYAYQPNYKWHEMAAEEFLNLTAFLDGCPLQPGNFPNTVTCIIGIPVTNITLFQLSDY